VCGFGKLDLEKKKREEKKIHNNPPSKSWLHNQIEIRRYLKQQIK
jgi:hypothetical protein